MKQYVFIPCVELGFNILFSIAQQLKSLYPERKQTLILLSHDRLVGRVKEEKRHFDEVIEFPWFQPSLRNFFRTIQLSSRFTNLLKRKFSSESTFFV